jgi:hypothetical protein
VWALFQSVDVALDLAWLLLSAATLLLWRFSGRPRQHTRSVVAILFLLVLLFPVISTADDIMEQVLMCDVAPSPLKSGKGIKQVIAPELAAAPALPRPPQPLAEGTRERAQSQSPVPFTFLLSSSSGIHSPPQF